MPSIFYGLEIARKALAVSQLNLQVIAHNVANANTPGYSRQRAELVPSPPLAYPSINRPGFPQQLGSGVQVDAVRSIRDEFLNEIIRMHTSSQGRNNVVDGVLGKLELVFNEPGETGLATALERFFAAWQDLANNPETIATRTSLREQTLTLIQTVKSIDWQLKQLVAEENKSLAAKVDEANSLARQIAALNVQISQIKGLGDNPNDLIDQRDLLIEKLSALLPVSAIEDSMYRMSVTVGGLKIVEEDVVHELKVVPGSENPADVELRLGAALVPQLDLRGELAGHLECRNEILPLFQGKLNELVSALINRVNVLHLRGFGLDGKQGRPFFNDIIVARMKGTVALPPGTTSETTLDQLGITAGDFVIQGIRVSISSDDVRIGKAITLGELLERITQSQPTVRAALETTAGGNPRVRLDLYNPPDSKTTISTYSVTTNFLSVVGLDNAVTEPAADSATYSNSAGMIQLFTGILENLNAIAAAGDDGSGVFPGPGNNKNALAIAALQSSPVAMGMTSFDDFYRSVISELGSRKAAAEQLVNNQSVLLDQLKVQRESVRGVSLDEEATYMITYQRIFEGAARVTQVIDSMLDTLINRTGV